MSEIITTGLIGKEDINFGYGTYSSVTLDGTTQSFSKVNLAALRPTYHVVSTVTPVFDLTNGTVQTLVLTADVTSSSIRNSVNADPIPEGSVLTLRLVQDGSGGRTFVWPVNVNGAGGVLLGSDADAVTVATLEFNDGVWEFLSMPFVVSTLSLATTQINGAVGYIPMFVTGTTLGNSTLLQATNGRLFVAPAATNLSTIDLALNQGQIVGLNGVTAANTPTNAVLCRLQAFGGSNGFGMLTVDFSGTGTYKPLVIVTGGNEALRCQVSGHVSIGSDVDNGYTLEVTGSLHVAGAFTVGSGLSINANGNLTKINNIAYSFPSGQGGVGQVLSNDGFGNLTWAAGGGGGGGGGAGGGWTDGGSNVYLTTQTDRVMIGLPGVVGDFAPPNFDGGLIVNQQVYVVAAGATSNVSLFAIAYSPADNAFKVGTSITGTGAQRPFRFITAGADRGQFHTTGNLSIGGIADNGFRLEVIGTSRVTGGLNVGASNEFAIGATGNITSINGITYDFPGVQGAAASVLQNDGSGVLSWAVGGGAGGGWTDGGTNVYNTTQTDRVMVGLGATPGDFSNSLFNGALIVNQQIYMTDGGSNTNTKLATIAWVSAAGRFFYGTGKTGSETAPGMGFCIDAAEKMTLQTTGNFTIGTTTDSGFKFQVAGTTQIDAAFSVGAATKFSVNASGDITFINSVPYTFPSAQGTPGQILQNDGSGNLVWSSAAASGGGWTDGGVNIYNTNQTDRVMVGLGTAVGDFVSSIFNGSLIINQQMYVTNGGSTSNTSLAGIVWDGGSNSMRIVTGQTGAGAVPPLRLYINGADRGQFHTNGNFTWGTISDSGFKFEVAGNARITAGITVGASQFTVDSVGNLTRVHDVAYSFPVIQGAAGTTLQNDGAGNLTWVVGSGGGGGFSDGGTNIYNTTQTDRVMVGLGAAAGDFASSTFNGALIANQQMYVASGTVTNASVAGIVYDGGSTTFLLASGVTGAGTNRAMRIRVAGVDTAQFHTNGNYTFGGVTDSGFTVNVNGTLLAISALSVNSASKFNVDSNGNITRLNSVPYSFPGSQGGSGQVLQNDGAGNLTWSSVSASSAGWTDGGTNIYNTTQTDRVMIGLGPSAGDFASSIYSGALILNQQFYVTNGAVTNATVAGISFDGPSGNFRIVTGATGAGTPAALKIFVNGSDRGQFHTNGNFSWGSISDGGFKLDVSGTLNCSSTISCNHMNTNGVTISGALSAGGVITASSFSGSGASLTSLNAANLFGTISDGLLSGNVAFLSSSNNFFGAQAIVGGNLNFSTGNGPASGGTATALASGGVECYQGSTRRATFGPNTTISIGGVERTVSRDAGTGVLSAF